MKNFSKPIGLYPILDLDYCTLNSIEPENLIELWESKSEYIPFFQLRGKSFSEKEYSDKYFYFLKKIKNLPIIINDFWKFAIREKAYGLHLGKEDFETLTRTEKEELFSSNIIKGTSSHSVSDLENLSPQDWDYSGIGPIFPTNTKRSDYPVLGAEFLNSAKLHSKIALAPIGGISENNLESVFFSGNFFPASISAFAKEKRFEKCISIIKKSLVQLERKTENGNYEKNNYF
ncbi:MAG: thiamine phosphate synthase [Leptospiraceae bacterium]|nr:thiamine phosphate synthase [Leptospiraceae bacterium]MCK6382107.1 thiamine phosphate synthase [Leptospiraceae bacterium]NUM42107.1 thiamine phosphate synthase [Leptospiraceae bacterium]